MSLKRGSMRLLDTFNTFTPSTRFTIELETPQRYIQSLWVWLRGTLTISAVTVPGVVHADGPANLIQDIEFRVNGKTIKIGSGASFLRIAQNYRQTGGRNSGLFSANAGVYTFEALIPLFFESPSTVAPTDTLLDGRNIQNMIITVRWGTTGSLIVGNTSTLALTGVTAQVYIVDTEPFPIEGAFWINREIETTYNNIVTTPAQRLSLPFQPGQILRAVQLRAIDGADLSDAVINSVDMRLNGGEEFPLNDLEDDFLQAMQLYDFGIDRMQEGYYFMELAENGRPLTTGIGAKLEGQSVNNVDLIVDTTVGLGATSIVAHTVELIPPGLLGAGL